MDILMCIPNISEGKRPEIIEHVVNTLYESPGIKVLNISPDADHNRTVLSYLGAAEDVLHASKAMAQTAIELIDMAGHKGEHPRLGAVDVVPFVPIRGIKMAQVVEVARQFGQFVGSLGIPVYYYENAATCPERVNLPDIRRGEYEELPQKLADPAWLPDEGPAVFVPKTGAVVTGARAPLVAFNVNLGTNDLALAKRIARAVRQSSGGYRYVRAMGIQLDTPNTVQVSMNMTNYKKTPLPRVLETIRAEAARYGVNVVGTELIGVVPLGVLEQLTRYYLQAHKFKTTQIVETALME